MIPLWLLLATSFAALFCGAAWIFLRLSLPKTTGTVKLPGLKAAVDIVRDRDGIPHIYASCKRDAWYGLGYVHAQDRLWQMDFQRRVAQGRTAEILGSRAAASDRLQRTVGLHQCAQAAWDNLPAYAREIAEAYAAGVNAALRSLRARLAPEFLIFRTQPEPWTGTDVVLMGKFFAWNLSGNYVTELLRERLVHALGPERAAQLAPPFRETSGPVIACRPHPPRFGAALELDSVGEGAGSNLWAVGPGKSDTGCPVLANDPHLPGSVPMSWYLAHVSAPGLDVIGATTPGLPAVLVGRNRNIAWGITNLGPDVQDLFHERLDGSGAAAEYQGAGEALHRRHERLKIRGQAAVEFMVRSTRHGPLISDAMRGPVRKNDPAATLSLQWTGFAENDPTIQCFLLLSEASNWDEFRNALRSCVAPALDFGYADTAGNIGHHSAGRIPVRRGGDGSVPAEGWSGDNDWTGFIPFDELPHSFNPPRQYVARINNPPAAEDYPWFLGCDWTEPYRAQRISELLEACPRLSLRDHERMQGDTVSLHAGSILPRLCALAHPDDLRGKTAVAMLRNWDGDAVGSSAAAVIFAAWMLYLPRVLLGPVLDPELLRSYEPWSSAVFRFVSNALDGRVWLAEAPDRAVERSLAQALDWLETRLGSDWQRWQWDHLHRAVFPHLPLHNVRPLRRFFDRSIPVPGDWSSINLGSYLHGQPFLQRNVAGYRQIIDLSGADGSVFVQAVGQSGHPLSRHFDDFLKDWAAVRYRPMRMERTTVERDARATLRLEPQGLRV